MFTSVCVCVHMCALEKKTGMCMRACLFLCVCICVHQSVLCGVSEHTSVSQA